MLQVFNILLFAAQCSVNAMQVPDVPETVPEIVTLTHLLHGVMEQSEYEAPRRVENFNIENEIAHVLGNRNSEIAAIESQNHGIQHPLQHPLQALPPHDIEMNSNPSINAASGVDGDLEIQEAEIQNYNVPPQVDQHGDTEMNSNPASLQTMPDSETIANLAGGPAVEFLPNQFENLFENNLDMPRIVPQSIIPIHVDPIFEPLRSIKRLYQTVPGQFFTTKYEIFHKKQITQTEYDLQAANKVVDSIKKFLLSLKAALDHDLQAWVNFLHKDMEKNPPVNYRALLELKKQWLMKEDDFKTQSGPLTARIKGILDQIKAIKMQATFDYDSARMKWELYWENGSRHKKILWIEQEKAKIVLSYITHLKIQVDKIQSFYYAENLKFESFADHFVEEIDSRLKVKGKNWRTVGDDDILDSNSDEMICCICLSSLSLPASLPCRVCKVDASRIHQQCLQMMPSPKKCPGCSKLQPQWETA